MSDTAAPPASSPPFTIMVVDDTPINLKLLGDQLSARHYRVVVAEDGEEALRRVNLVQPDLILLDVLMPGIDGFETCRRLKGNAQTRDIPVIFMSALEEIADRVAGFEAGAVDYVTKPFQIAEVMARVTTHLALRAALAERQRAEAALQRANEELEQRVAQRTAELAETVSHLKEEVAQRERMETFRTGQSWVLEMIARGAPLEDTLSSLVRLIESQADGMIASILLLDDDGQHVRLGAAPNLPDAFLRALDGAAIGPAAWACGMAMYRRGPVVVTDILLDPLWGELRELALQQGLRACWSNPVFGVEGKVVGSFAMYFRSPRAPSASDMRLIELATRNAGIAIERKRAEHALADSEARFRSLVELSSDQYWEQDTEFRFTFSPQLQAWRGALPPETFIGKARWELPGTVGVTEAEWAAHRATLQAHQPFRHFEYGITDHRGDIHYASVSGEPVFDTGGQFCGYRGTAQDITLRKAAEAALKLTLLEQQAILDNTVVGISFVVDGVIQRCNRAFEQLFGWPPGELIGKSTRVLFPSDEAYQASAAAAYPLIAAGRAYVGDVQFVRKDGTPLWCVDHGKAVDPGDLSKGTVWATHDISARKEAERALEEAKAQLEAGMAALEQRNREIALLGELSSMLHSCLSADEAYRAVARFGARLFPGDAGALFVEQNVHGLMELVAEWGEPVGLEPIFTSNDCWALRRGGPHRVSRERPTPVCAHDRSADHVGRSSLCVPLVAQSETMGLLHFQLRADDEVNGHAGRQRVAVALAEQAALALAGIRLRAALRSQSA